MSTLQFTIDPALSSAGIRDVYEPHGAHNESLQGGHGVAGPSRLRRVPAQSGGSSPLPAVPGPYVVPLELHGEEELVR